MCPVSSKGGQEAGEGCPRRAGCLGREGRPLDANHSLLKRGTCFFQKWAGCTLCH